MMQQLTLNIDVRHEAQLSDLALSFLKPIWNVCIQCINGEIPLLLLIGEEKTGKTHVLKALSNAYANVDKTSIIVPLRHVGSGDADLLSDLQRFDVIMIDDVDLINQLPHMEHALIVLMNQCQSNGQQMVLTSRCNKAVLQKTMLPDLYSRLVRAAIFDLPSVLTYDERLAFIVHMTHKHAWRFETQLEEQLARRVAAQSGRIALQLDQLYTKLVSTGRQPHLRRLDLEQYLFEH